MGIQPTVARVSQSQRRDLTEEEEVPGFPTALGKRHTQ